MIEGKPGLLHEAHSLMWLDWNMSANTSAPVRVHFQIQSFSRQVCAALIGNSNRGLKANNCDRLGHWGMWNYDIGLTLKAGFCLCNPGSPTCCLTYFRSKNDKGERVCWLELICWCLRVGCHVGLKGLLWCIASFTYFSACFDCMDVRVWVGETVTRSNYESSFWFFVHKRFY